MHALGKNKRETLSNGDAGGARITIEGLSHEFFNRHTGDVIPAVDNVDLVIEPGEFLTLVGPSGCGKSTLLKAIAGLIVPTLGTIMCDDRKVVAPGPDRGVVFQEHAILPWRTVQRNIGHGLELQGVPKQERKEKVAYLIELMNLQGFQNHYPHELSGGMRQRVAVARTWATSPAVILMDEPFAAVDAQTRITLQEELLRISKVSNCTLMLITHNVNEAVFLGDRVAVMSRRPGRIKELVKVPVPRDERSLESLTEPEMEELSENLLRLVREEVA